MIQTQRTKMQVLHTPISASFLQRDHQQLQCFSATLKRVVDGKGENEITKGCLEIDKEFTNITSM